MDGVHALIRSSIPPCSELRCANPCSRLHASSSWEAPPSPPPSQSWTLCAVQPGSEGKFDGAELFATSSLLTTAVWACLLHCRKSITASRPLLLFSAEDMVLLLHVECLLGFSRDKRGRILPAPDQKHRSITRSGCVKAALSLGPRHGDLR